MLAPEALAKRNFERLTWQELVAQGDSHLSRQELGLSDECYVEALREVKRVEHTTDDLVECMEKLAAVLQMEDKTEDVLPLYKRSLHLLQKAHGKNSPRIIPTVYALGAVLEAECEHRKTVKEYTRALAINEKTYDPLSLEIADSLHRLARAKVEAFLVPEAEPQYLLSLSIYMRQPMLSSTTGLENLLADYLDLLRKLEMPNRILTSEFQTQLLKDRLGILSQNMGVPKSFWQKEVSALLTQSNGGTTQNNLDNPGQPVSVTPEDQNFLRAKSSVESNKQDGKISNQKFEANETDFYERMVAIDMKALGPNHPTVADDLNALASVYVAQHRYAEAKPLLTRALAIYETVYGRDNLLVTRTLGSLSQIARTKDTSEITDLAYTDPSPLSKIPPQAKKLEIALRLNDLAFLCFCQGKIENAVTIYHWALASTAGATGEQSVLSAACLNDFAKVLRSSGDSIQSGRMQDTASAITTKAEFAQNILLY